MSNSMVFSPAPARRLGASVLALLAGFAVAVVLSIATDLILHKIGFYPALGKPMTSQQEAVATIYRTLFGILSAWVTARLAPYRPLAHALIGGAIGTMIALTGAVTTWNLNLGPHWYPVALVILALPTAWVGGKIRVTQLRRARQ